MLTVQDSDGCGWAINGLVQAVRSCMVSTDQRGRRLRGVVGCREDSGEKTKCEGEDSWLIGFYAGSLAGRVDR